MSRAGRGLGYSTIFPFSPRRPGFQFYSPGILSLLPEGLWARDGNPPCRCHRDGRGRGGRTRREQAQGSSVSRPHFPQRGRDSFLHLEMKGKGEVSTPEQHHQLLSPPSGLSVQALGAPAPLRSLHLWIRPKILLPLSHPWHIPPAPNLEASPRSKSIRLWAVVVEEVALL